MSNSRQNRDEKEAQQFDEETEYHFVEDEFTYEVENDMKSTSKSDDRPMSQEGIQKRLRQFKERLNEYKMSHLVMMGGGFLALVLLIYKVLSPSSSTEMKSIPLQPASLPAGTMNNQNMLSKPAIMHPQQIQSAPTDSPSIMPPQPGNTMQQQPGAQLQPQVASGASSMDTMGVMPMKSEPVSVPSGVVPASQIENKLSQVNQSNQTIINQMQAEYTQKLNEYAQQNKNLQEEVKTLTNRVSALESELNQLLQALMKTNIATQVSANAPQDAQNTETTPSQSPEVRLPYTVQAIIPGRAWLRNENGETVTVGEGDQLKEGGRVSKIDPYDGVVEVTTGKKTITLSYGNTEQQ